MEEIQLVKNKEKCCGCAGCANICPKNAIEMCEDEYGFKYPRIDRDKCIKCGLCVKTCAYQNVEELQKNMESYVAITTDNEILMNSASGGIFGQIANNFIENGVVYGCAMENENDKLTPKHIRVTEKKDIIKLQGSKYVQSDMNDIYKQVKEDLKNDNNVLFSGTPCQIAELKRYLDILKINDDKLFTIDIICHGVPNKKMFQDYIELEELKNKNKIKEFYFRDKTKGWGLQSKIIFEDKKQKINDSHFSSFYQMFLDSKIYRENCYSCKYACKERSGDITLGDYWGISNEHPEYLIENGGDIEIKNGISCVLVNNEKGKEIIEKYMKNINIKISKIDKVAKKNKQLNQPCINPESREKIMNSYKEKGYKEIDKLYYKKMGIKKYALKVWTKIPMKIKEKIR